MNGKSIITIMSIMNAIDSMGLSEKEFFFGLMQTPSVDFYLSRVDKGEVSGITESEDDSIKRGTKATPKRDRKSRKNHLRDKARHGYHLGAKKEGYTTYDRWGKREKVEAIQKRDFRDRTREVESYTEATIDEMVMALHDHWKPFLDKEFQWLNSRNMAYIESEARMEWQYIQGVGDREMVSFLDDLFPADGKEAKREAVRQFLVPVKRNLEYIAVVERNIRLTSELRSIGDRKKETLMEMEDLRKKLDTLEAKVSVLDIHKGLVEKEMKETIVF